MPIVVPANSTEDWRMLLRDPVKQWRQGYSAKSLADHWQNERGFPEDVQELFESSDVEGVRDAEMLFGMPEAETKLPGGGFPSYTDLFVLGKCSDGLITVAVEGKVNESFDELVDDWLHKNERNENRQRRLEGLCGILGMEASDALELRYQLLHRTASALIEAERYSATTAVMLVHSFSSEKMWFDDYEAFGKALGASLESGGLIDVGIKSGRRLLLGWLTSSVKPE